jgi:16S rRNA (cytidine1402-2'-O)-methyltransferase
VSTSPGVLHVVATPIGNLEDFSPRARTVLAEVDVVLAEDTRNCKQLLHAFGIQRQVIAYHDHNERERSGEWVDKLQQGQSIALISDAGTPLISDPGYRLVRAAQLSGIEVVAVPGPSAVLAALSVSGLATNRFTFEGFVPARSGERRRLFESLKSEPRTLVFFETPHRLLESLADMVAIFGADREASLARELTKRYERTITTRLADLQRRFAEGQEPCRGEMVVVVAGAVAVEPDEAEAERCLRILLRHLAPGEAAGVAAEITGCSRRTAYRKALQLREDEEEPDR